MRYDKMVTPPCRKITFLDNKKTQADVLLYLTILFRFRMVGENAIRRTTFPNENVSSDASPYSVKKGGVWGVSPQVRPNRKL